MTLSAEHRRGGNRRAAGLVLSEFAICLPLFILLALSAVDFMLLISGSNQIETAVRSAGRAVEVYEFEQCDGSEGVEAVAEQLFEDFYGAPALTLGVNMYLDSDTEHEFVELSFEEEPIRCLLCWFSSAGYSAQFIFARDELGPCDCDTYPDLCP